MGKARLEAFSDGVIAVIITIMVLEMKVPYGDELATLQPVIPALISYVLSFVYVISSPSRWPSSIAGCPSASTSPWRSCG